MTTKELIARYNAVARDLGRPELTRWKASKEALGERLDALRAAQVMTDPLAIPEAAEPLGDAGPDQVPAEAAEAPGDDHGEPDEARGGIGQMIAELLVDAEGYGYGEIVDIVRGEFPEASTSKRSVASVAAALRRKGVEVPMRRKAFAKA